MRKTVGCPHIIIRDSSAVEQEAVNFEVAGSNPVPGAKIYKSPSRWLLYFIPVAWLRTKATCQLVGDSRASSLNSLITFLGLIDYLGPSRPVSRAKNKNCYNNSMKTSCSICKILKEPGELLTETKKWSVRLGNNQAYFGRAFVVLRNHKASLSDLSKQEWSEFEMIVEQLESAYKLAFNANPINWSCLMNNAFRNGASNPHVHWHVYPRYKNAPVLNGEHYEDSLYGEHYNPTAEQLVTDDVVHQIAEILRSNIPLTI